jgi:type II secretory pathway component PulF
MEVLLVILVIPTLGGCLLLAEWQSQSALSGRDRRRSRIAVLILGVTLLPVATGLMAFAVKRFLELDVFQSVFCTIQVLLLCVLLFAAWSAIRLALLGEERDLSVREAARHSHYASRMRMSAWLLVGFPLLWVAGAGIVVVAPLLYVVAVWSAAGRARQCRLLWLLAIATENGLPLADEIDAFALEFRGSWRWRLRNLADRLRDGSSLADGLEVDGRLLPVPDLVAVRVGEEAGTLPATLRATAVHRTAVLKQTYVNGSVAALASYYWLVIAILLSMITGLMYFIVPKFKVIFHDFGIALPDVTQFMIDVSDHIATYFWLIIPTLSLPMSLVFVLSYMYLVGWGNLNWPLVMRWFPRRDAPGILRGLAVVAASDRPFPPVVAAMAERHPRRDLGQRLERIGLRLEAGDDPWMSLSQEGFLSGNEAEAVGAAARARHLPFVLDSLADSIDRTRQQRLLWLIELVNPLVIIGLGVFVAMYCVAFFLPLVQVIRGVL